MSISIIHKLERPSWITMKHMGVGDIAIFGCPIKNTGRIVSGYATKLKRRFETKTIIVVDPEDGTPVKALLCRCLD